MSKLDITNKTISAFTLYKFATDISKPFTSFPAFSKKIIDRDGYFLVLPEEIPNSISTYELFVIYLKRLLNQIPNPSTSAKLKSLTTTLTLFKECLLDYGLDGNKIIQEMKDFLIHENLIEEVNSVGGGFQVGQVGEPGNFAGFDPPLFFSVHQRRRKKKKNPLNFFVMRRNGDGSIDN